MDEEEPPAGEPAPTWEEQLHSHMTPNVEQKPEDQPEATDLLISAEEMKNLDQCSAGNPGS